MIGIVNSIVLVSKLRMGIETTSDSNFINRQNKNKSYLHIDSNKLVYQLLRALHYKSNTITKESIEHMRLLESLLGNPCLDDKDRSLIHQQIKELNKL